MDSLRGPNAAGANDLGQYLPVGIPDTTTYPNSDYYEIELGQCTVQMHKDLPPTTIRGYRQTNTSDSAASQRQESPPATQPAGDSGQAQAAGQRAAAAGSRPRSRSLC